jgi:hypothetical protein
MRKKDPHFVLCCELSYTNDSIYKLEAERLLNEKFLTKIIGKFKIDYYISNGEARYEMFNLGNPDELIAGMDGPLPIDKSDQILEIKEYFAHSEATAILDSK